MISCEMTIYMAIYKILRLGYSKHLKKIVQFNYSLTKLLCVLVRNWSTEHLVVGSNPEIDLSVMFRRLVERM